MNTVDAGAGTLADPSSLLNVDKLLAAYYEKTPDPSRAAERVSFGTSGHRGSAFATSFNETHVLAIAQAICDFRKERGITGPLFLGKDSHGLSAPAFESTLEVLAANDVPTMIDSAGRFTPTPAVSHAIICHNRGRDEGLADGIVITPSHDPPEDGGFKYNPSHGGPAETAVTSAIERAANAYLTNALAGVKRMPIVRARASASLRAYDYVSAYIGDLNGVVDMDAIRSARPRLGIDPLGGASVSYWGPIVERFGLNATILNPKTDPTFAFVPRDWDGKIRMDCSSPYAMCKVLEAKDNFDISIANDTDADRHGIVCSSGLMQPNHYLVACIQYLNTHRQGWPSTVGKTLVSSAVIDKVAAHLGGRVFEVPVGFKWFVGGLSRGVLFFAGEESAGATFLKRNGEVWTTDKDGIIAGLLAAEILATTGKNPAALYQAISQDVGPSWYARIDRPASATERKTLSCANPADITVKRLAGDPIEQVLTKAPGNGEPFGGIKLVTKRGWFAARPSGTEDIYKVYAESFASDDHLRAIQTDANAVIAALFARDARHSPAAESRNHTV